MNEIECPICFEDMKLGEYVVIPSCLHKYHPSCLRQWEKKKKKTEKFLCPECNTKYDFVVKTEKKVVKQPISQKIDINEKSVKTGKTLGKDPRHKDPDDLCNCNIL